VKPRMDTDDTDGGFFKGGRSSTWAVEWSCLAGAALPDGATMFTFPKWRAVRRQPPLAGVPENAGRTFRRSETRHSSGLTPFRHPSRAPTKAFPRTRGDLFLSSKLDGQRNIQGITIGLEAVPVDIDEDGIAESCGVLRSPVGADDSAQHLSAVPGQYKQVGV